jgi:hypothetical protein
MEWWSGGVLVLDPAAARHSITPALHYSITPWPYAHDSLIAKPGARSPFLCLCS